MHCGWAIVNESCGVHGSHPLTVECGLIDLGSHTVKRWLNLEKEINGLFTRYSPELIIIEENFAYKNIRTTAVLNQLRGSVLLLAALRGITVSFVDNNSAKKKMLGGTRYWDPEVGKYVGVTKDMMKNAVSDAICSSSHVPTSHDAADAIALALTYYDASVPKVNLTRKPIG